MIVPNKYFVLVQLFLVLISLVDWQTVCIVVLVCCVAVLGYVVPHQVIYMVVVFVC